MESDRDTEYYLCKHMFGDNDRYACHVIERITDWTDNFDWMESIWGCSTCEHFEIDKEGKNESTQIS